jgi:chaperonin cofactor prefoldin
MKQKEMIENLTKQLHSLAEELQNLEKQFSFKKEQFLKVQGALEALNEIEAETE